MEVEMRANIFGTGNGSHWRETLKKFREAVVRA